MTDKIPSQKKRLVVIGGGAAGFFCAVNAARLDPMLEVQLLEKTGKWLSKVKVSGGGRCNLTHACFDIDEMSRCYPRGRHFVKKAFHQFFTRDTIAWFNERGVVLKTEADGRMFPASNSSQSIIDCLQKEAHSRGVMLRTGITVKGIRKTESGFLLDTEGQDDKGIAGEIPANYVCVAAGGYPKAAMFDWLLAVGHHIETPLPSLFTFNLPGNPITKLMGVSVENARVRIAGTKLENSGPLLITHWGLSGPAILKLSAWGARELAEKEYAFTAVVNWLPALNDHDLKEGFAGWRKEGGRLVYQRNFLGLPQRLWEYFLQQAGITENINWGNLTAAAQKKLTRLLTQQEFAIKGKTTFREEFVTAGGIRLTEIDPNTMMSRLVPGLFFAGEILDVDGITGGYNFQHAWTSGWIAANSIAQLS